MECHKFNMSKTGEQPNYGIYDFFKYSDEVSPLKCSYVIDEDYYVINIDSAKGRDHDVLIGQIASEFYMNPKMFGGSLGKDMEFICEKEDLSNNELQIIIEMLEEMKQYYIDTKRDKNIAIYGGPFRDTPVSGNKFYCKDIDNLIAGIQDIQKSRGL